MIADKYLILGYLYLSLIAFILIIKYLGLKWGILAYALYIILSSFPLAYYYLKKFGFIDMARCMGGRNNKIFMGLEIMRKINPKKAAKMEKEVLKELGGKKNGTAAKCKTGKEVLQSC